MSLKASDALTNSDAQAQPYALTPNTVELIPTLGAISYPEYSRANSYPWSPFQLTNSDTQVMSSPSCSDTTQVMSSPKLRRVLRIAGVHRGGVDFRRRLVLIAWWKGAEEAFEWQEILRHGAGAIMHPLCGLQIARGLYGSRFCTVGGSISGDAWY